MEKIPKYLFLLIIILMLIGVLLLIFGIVYQMSNLFYVSGVFSFSGIVLTIYLCIKHKKPNVVFNPLDIPPKIYKDPTMKRNKSDTNLELMQTDKNNNYDKNQQNNETNLV